MTAPASYTSSASRPPTPPPGAAGNPRNKPCTTPAPFPPLTCPPLSSPRYPLLDSPKTFPSASCLPPKESSGNRLQPPPNSPKPPPLGQPNAPVDPLSPSWGGNTLFSMEPLLADLPLPNASHRITSYPFHALRGVAAAVWHRAIALRTPSLWSTVLLLLSLLPSLDWLVALLLYYYPDLYGSTTPVTPSI